MFKKKLPQKALCCFLLFASAPVFSQVKIGSNPTVINAANNLEVESSDPLKKVTVNKTTGKVTIADGSQGTAKILTSDANGVATWQPPIQTTNLYVDATTPTSTYVQSITASNTNGGYNKLILTNEIADRGANYNNTTSEITIPSDGIYHLSAGTSKWSATTDGLSLSLSLMVNDNTDLPLLLDGGTGNGVANNGNYHLRGTFLGYFSANDKIVLSLRCNPVGSYAPTIDFRASFMKMVKVSN